MDDIFLLTDGTAHGLGLRAGKVAVGALRHQGPELFQLAVVDGLADGAGADGLTLRFQPGNDVAFYAAVREFL